MKTSIYTIANKISGAKLGDYVATSETEALDKMAIDAGYLSFADACEAAEASRDEFLITLFGETYGNGSRGAKEGTS